MLNEEARPSGDADWIARVDGYLQEDIRIRDQANMEIKTLEIEILQDELEAATIVVMAQQNRLRRAKERLLSLEGEVRGYGYQTCPEEVRHTLVKPFPGCFAY